MASGLHGVVLALLDFRFVMHFEYQDSFASDIGPNNQILRPGLEYCSQFDETRCESYPFRNFGRFYKEI